MHPHLYFAVAVLTASPALSESLEDLARSGEFRVLERRLAAAIDARQTGGQEEQAYADLQLALGRYEEAERLYRDSLGRIASDKKRLRLVSCRHAAWQSLFLHRHKTALACFCRILEDNDTGTELRLESWLGLTLVTFQMGHLNTTWECTEQLIRLSATHETSHWMSLATVLQGDLFNQLHMRASDGLVDHILWHGLVSDMRVAPADRMPVKDRDVPSVMQRHSAFQLHLRALIDGNQQFIVEIDAYIRWASQLGTSEYHRFIRVDVALAALAGGALDVTQRMLDEFGEAGPYLPLAGHWMLDHLYCQVNVLRWKGRCGRGDAEYRRYCRLAILRAREQAIPVGTLPSLLARQCGEMPGQDINARLAGKYRRAYKFLVENLDRPNLSVREIAAHIGVTARALQLVMRSSLGMSPTELIRRLRMERIRHELLGSGQQDGIFAIAEKWGVRHHSTLAIAYRREYDESPTETIVRSEA